MVKDVAQDTAEQFLRYAPAQTTASVELVAVPAEEEVVINVVVVITAPLANGLMPMRKMVMVQTTTENMKSMKHQEDSAREVEDHQLHATTLTTTNVTDIASMTNMIEMNSYVDLALPIPPMMKNFHQLKKQLMKTQMRVHSPDDIYCSSSDHDTTFN